MWLPSTLIGVISSWASSAGLSSKRSLDFPCDLAPSIWTSPAIADMPSQQHIASRSNQAQAVC